MSLARAERADLIDFLGTLTPAQWETHSLREGWRVRDVVAHMFSYDELSVAGLLARVLRAGLVLARVNAAGVAAHADLGIDELLALAGRCRQPRGLTTCFGGRIALTDATIHHQDIRRPLGRPREIPPERLRVALDFARTAPPLGASSRIRGLTLVATDLDWSAGDGPVVEGPAESLLMAIAGRAAVAAELGGAGQPTIAERLRA